MPVLSPTVCPRSLAPFHVVTYCIKWVKTSGTHSMLNASLVSGGELEHYFGDIIEYQVEEATGLGVTVRDQGW